MFTSLNTGFPPSIALVLGCFAYSLPLLAAEKFTISESAEQVVIESSTLQAAIRKTGYVSGVYRQTFLDKKSGFRDPGMGLDIADFILESGSDRRYRDQLADRMIYYYGEDVYRDRPSKEVHGSRPKRKVEGPQICTQAKELDPQTIQGADFVAIRQSHTFPLAAPGRQAGSTWEQTLVFPEGKRYFISSHRIASVNDSSAMFFRIDMPGHIKHNQGDTFSEIYLSYHGRISSAEFRQDFPPDQRYNYRRDTNRRPQRLIRAIHLRDPVTGESGPWLAGLVLDPNVVHEAWCHQRGYVCMILEFGGRPIESGESFGAAFIVGFFDSIDEMNRVYDQHAGHTRLEVSQTGWQLLK